jgi:hypothetical protein
MARICPTCGTANSADAERCACGYEWVGNIVNQPNSTCAANNEAPVRSLVMAGFRLAAGSLKFRLFQVLTVALVLVVLACGVGFMEARNPVASALFAVGFLGSFGGAAVAIVWLREKLM